MASPRRVRLRTGHYCSAVQAQPADMVITAAWLAAHLDDPNVVVISTGDRDGFERGHVPGASFVEHMETLGPDHRLLEPTTLAAVLGRAGAGDDAQRQHRGVA